MFWKLCYTANLSPLHQVNAEQPSYSLLKTIQKFDKVKGQQKSDKVL